MWNLQGRASIKDAHTVEVNGKQITSKYICVAVGGTPTMLNIPGVHCLPCCTRLQVHLGVRNLHTLQIHEHF